MEEISGVFSSFLKAEHFLIVLIEKSMSYISGKIIYLAERCLKETDFSNCEFDLIFLDRVLKRLLYGWIWPHKNTR